MSNVEGPLAETKHATEADASVVPSGENATDLIVFLWPSRVYKVEPQLFLIPFNVPNKYQSLLLPKPFLHLALRQTEGECGAIGP